MTAAKKRSSRTKKIPLEFEVHSAARSSVQEEIETSDGRKRVGSFEVLTVEFVGNGSAFSLHFEDMDLAEKMFQAGKKVTFTLTGAK